MKEFFKSYGTFFGLLCLASSVFYFSVEIGRIRKSIPVTIKQVEDFNNEGVFQAINELKQFSSTLPSILKQIEETRALVPPILTEIRQVRESLPTVERNIDKISDIVDNSKQIVSSSAPEVSKISALVPKVIEEVQTTRNVVPDYLAQAERIVENARQIGKDSGKGVVSGLVSGVVSLPFNVVSDLVSDDEFELEKKDKALIKETAENLVRDGSVGSSKTWHNSKSGNSGTIRIAKVDKSSSCKTLKLALRQKGRLKKSGEVNICPAESGGWKVTSSSFE